MKPVPPMTSTVAGFGAATAGGVALAAEVAATPALCMICSQTPITRAPKRASRRGSSSPASMPR